MAVVITGTGSYLPERILTNADLEKMVDTSDEWIVTRTGIRERHIARKDEKTSDMAAAAARRAIEDSGVAPSQIDMIIVATATPDVPFPSTACLVQNVIGAGNAFCFDLSAACSGFLYGLECCRRFIEQGGARTALVIGAEKLSDIVDWKDRDTCVLFGDGAGAVVVQAAEGKRGIIGTVMGSDGKLCDLLKVARDRRAGADCAAEPSFSRIVMSGREVFKHAVRCMSDAGLRVLEQHGLNVEDVDLLIPHQANVRIMDAVSTRLNLAAGKMFVNLDRVGNVSAASVPIAMDEAARSGALKRGDLLLLVAFGAGFTWSATVLEW